MPCVTQLSAEGKLRAHARMGACFTAVAEPGSKIAHVRMGSNYGCDGVHTLEKPSSPTPSISKRFSEASS